MLTDVLERGLAMRSESIFFFKSFVLHCIIFLIRIFASSDLLEGRDTIRAGGKLELHSPGG